MTDSNDLCPICGEGSLHPRIGKNPSEYKGHTAELDVRFSVCDACGSEQSDAEQLRTNKRAMMAFKKRVDGLLTGAEVRELRTMWGLSQAQAARIFGGGPVAFSKYESDDVAQSESMDKLLRLSAELPTAFAALARQVGEERAVTGAEWQDITSLQKTSHVIGSYRRSTLRLVSSSTPDGEQRKTYVG